VDDDALFTCHQYIIAIGYGDGKQVTRNTSLQVFPGHSTIVSTQNYAARAHYVSSLSVSEREGIKPFF
jgi:hypothetical protein